MTGKKFIQCHTYITVRDSRTHSDHTPIEKDIHASAKANTLYKLQGDGGKRNDAERLANQHKQNSTRCH
jgi:hypothetical protein